MDDHLIINLRVADTRYPLKVKRKDEESYRRAAGEIDYKLGQYRNHFEGSDSHPLREADYMAMTAIQAVGEKAELEIRNEFFEVKLRELMQKLDGYLQKNVI